MITKKDIKARIINKLVRWKKWGGAHTENILKGLPSHLRGDKNYKESSKRINKKSMVDSSKENR